VLASPITKVDVVGIPSTDPDRSRHHMANFSDPDGNPLTLHRRYAPYGEKSVA
jgi:hypothetical protein